MWQSNIFKNYIIQGCLRAAFFIKKQVKNNFLHYFLAVSNSLDLTFMTNEIKHNANLDC